VERTPPLREHREDIPALSRALLTRFGVGEQSPPTPDFEESLLLHPWPLNVRGFSNMLSIVVIATLPGQPFQFGSEVREALQDNRIEGPPNRPAGERPSCWTRRASGSSSAPSTAAWPRSPATPGSPGPSCTGYSGRQGSVRPSSAVR